jgi:hypothetical protein
MKKLSLNIEDLAVETFSTGSDETGPQRGTVKARQYSYTYTQPHWYTCQQWECEDTMLQSVCFSCGWSCPPCDDSSVCSMSCGAETCEGPTCSEETCGLLHTCSIHYC